MSERYYRDLSSFCLRVLGNPELATDVAQASYAKLRRVGHTHSTLPRALLFDTARQLIRAKFTPAFAGATRKAASPSTSGSFKTPEGSAVLQALQRLPRRRREAFILHRFDGLAPTDIARRMGLSVQAVQQHIRCAMLVCRQANQV